MLKWIFNKAVGAVNSNLLSQDYIIAESLDPILAQRRLTDDERLFYEAIFLDICDRTQCHPVMNFEINKEGKIVWEFDPSFSRDDYINSNWFHDKADLYEEHHTRLKKAKSMYLDKTINFLEYYIIRTQTYSSLEINDHEQFFKSIDLEKYFSELKNKFSLSLYSNID